jgi:CRP-like cAMP-binding protein
MTTESSGRFPFIRQFALTDFLSAEHVAQLEKLGRPATRKAGATLFKQGARAETLYMVRDGLIELRALPPGRTSYQTIELVGPGRMVGDESAMGERRYFAMARVLEDARLLGFPINALEELALEHPGIALGLLRCACMCLVKMMRRSAILAHAPANVGLRLLLEDLAAASNGKEGRDHQVVVRVTQSQLGGMLHLSRESVGRMLREMAEEGLIELARGEIRVLAVP